MRQRHLPADGDVVDPAGFGRAQLGLGAGLAKSVQGCVAKLGQRTPDAPPAGRQLHPNLSGSERYSRLNALENRQGRLGIEERAVFLGRLAWVDAKMAGRLAMPLGLQVLQRFL